MATEEAGRMPELTLDQQPKTFGLAHMTLFSVSAILVADTVASSAAIGVQGLTLWVILGVLFFIPYGFVTAELGSAWPEEGGFYVWIREAFGPRWSSICGWLYWINVAYWAPSVFVIFAGTLSVVFWPSMSQTAAEIMVIVLIWVIVGVCIVPLRLAKWVPSVSAAFKMIILLVLGVAGAAFAIKNGAANSFAASKWSISWSGNYSFVPIIIYSLMGFELMNSAGAAIRRPKRDVPKMVLISGVAIVAVYMFASFGILASLKLSDLSIVTGIADAMKLSFTNVLGGYTWLYDIFMVGLLFTLFANMVTWTLGSSHSYATTGLDKTAPGVFGHVNKRYLTPDYAFILMGVVATALTVLDYQLFATKESVFWTIFALSSIVYLIVYLFMFPALLILRRKYPDKDRPYVVPGGKVGAWVSVVLCEAGILFAIVLFFYAVPEGTPRLTYWGITGIGTIVTLLVGLWFYERSRRKTEHPAAPPGDREATTM
jgi:amino acid transporter